MEKNEFDPSVYYDSYPSRVILRPGYPARAQYKSTLMWDLYGRFIMKELGKLNAYADIGGCFGFGANAMAFHIAENQNGYPETKVFEISRDFITIGKQLFPYIDFVQEDFGEWRGDPQIFDLVTLFDVIEHLPNPEAFLSNLALHTRFALIKTPMETTGEWRGGSPSAPHGDSHPDGHINFFTPKSYLDLLSKSGLKMMRGKLVKTIFPLGTQRILYPEAPNLVTKRTIKSILRQGWPSIWSLLIAVKNFQIVPYQFERKYRGGGEFLCLVKSKTIL